MSPSLEKEYTRTAKPGNAKLFIYKWAASNMFLFKRWDGGFYLVLYILVPVFATIFSLSALGTELHNAAYCYFSITISALSCIHDAFGRWEDRAKSYKNTKLKLIIICSIIAFIYGFFQFFAISIGGTLTLRNDKILLAYIPAAIIAFLDFLAIISRANSLSDAVYR